MKKTVFIAIKGVLLAAGIVFLCLSMFAPNARNWALSAALGLIVLANILICAGNVISGKSKKR